ncbi:MAG: hypothetical protein WD077_09675 [Bacteroidia bacterium]
MKKLTGLEYDILNVLYFVEPFENILDEVDAPKNQVADSLRLLIDNKLVVAMKYSETDRDFKRSFIYDADNMYAYHYLITRDGLVAHNSVQEDED